MGNLITNLFGSNVEADGHQYKRNVPKGPSLDQHRQYRQKLEKEGNERFLQPERPSEVTFALQPPLTLYNVSASTNKWKYVISDPELIRNLLKSTEYENWRDILYTNSSPYQLLPCSIDSVDFFAIKNLFVKTNKRCYQVREIKKIVNPYLMMQYQLMKERYRRMYRQVTEQILFHGTRKANLDSIFKYNFDWRLYGQARGHKFGQGVSFTPISNYATHYGDKTYEKVMIVATVLVSNSCLGNRFMNLPPKDCETTTNNNKHVFVKYEDNTFYPHYVIYYEGFE